LILQKFHGAGVSELRAGNAQKGEKQVLTGCQKPGKHSATTHGLAV